MSDQAGAGAGEPGRAGRVLPVNDLFRSGPVTTDLPAPARALAVGAHPDDIEFGCGGTLAKWASAGCEIHHLVLTDGSKGTWDPKSDPAALVATRQEEQREAARILGGGDVGFLGYIDGELRNGIPEQSEVCRWIRLTLPDVVLGHDPWRRYRLHPDHRHAGFVLTDALVAARDPLFFPDQGLPPHRPSALLLWEADIPDHVESVEGFADVKMRALLAHRSQHETTMGVGTGDGSTTAEDLDAFRRRVFAKLAEHGSLATLTLGESFHLISEI